MLDAYYWAWVTSLVACGLYGFYRWLLRKRRKCFEVFKDTGIPGPPTDSLISGNADAFWKPTQIESISRWLKQYGDVFGTCCTYTSTFLCGATALLSPVDVPGKKLGHACSSSSAHRK